LIILGLVQLSLISKSQEKIQLYFNNNWEVTNKDKAVYVREAEYDLQNFTLNGKVTDRDLTGNLMMEGNYVNGKRNGEFKFYYADGNIESTGKFLNGKRNGKWGYNYPNGLLEKGFERITGQFKDSLKSGVWKLTRISDNKLLQTDRFRKGKLKYVKIGMIDKQSVSTSYHDYPSRMQQRLQDEMRTGISHQNLIGDASVHEIDNISWRAIGSNATNTQIPGVIIHGEGSSLKWVPDIRSSNNFVALGTGTNLRMVRMDKIPIAKLNKTEMLLLDTIAFSKSLTGSNIETFFKTISATEIRINNRGAIYQYGNYLLMEFISRNLHYPNSAIPGKSGGTVFVKVAIDSSGNTKEVKISKGISEDWDKEAVRVIALINKWLPAMKEGKAIESTITIPVKFELRN